MARQSDSQGARKRGGGRRKQEKSNGDEFQSSPEIRTALISGNTFRGRPVQYAVVDGLALFEGDIILGTAEEVEQQTAQLRSELTGEFAAAILIKGAQYRWPNCRVPYTIDSSLPNQARVTDAIAHWEAKTVFRFVPRTSETDYVTFRPWSGCSAHVGKRGGQQFVNLASGCTLGNTIHEIAHAVGFWHEQSRSDRDAYVTIHWDKITPGYEHNFNQHITDGDDVGPYDYDSIMHYPRKAFSVDGSDTITPTDPTANIGQRNGLSPGDIAAANGMCPKPLKEVAKDLPKDTIFDTRKELIKDLQFDTRKEIVTDTQKELLKDRIKDVTLDPKSRLEPIGPTVTTVLPALRPGAAPAAGVPFAVATSHQAPAAEPAQLEAAARTLEAQLEQLADQIAQADQLREQLQAQYDETAALLRQTVDAHDQGAGS